MMLCPETWNFAAPEQSIKYQTGKTKDIAFGADCFFYNHLVLVHLKGKQNRLLFLLMLQIAVVLPNISKVPDELLGILSSDCDYYKIVNVPINEFVTKNFLKNFIEKGNYLLSVVVVG